MYEDGSTPSLPVSNECHTPGLAVEPMERNEVEALARGRYTHSPVMPNY